MAIQPRQASTAGGAGNPEADRLLLYLNFVARRNNENALRLEYATLEALNENVNERGQPIETVRSATREIPRDRAQEIKVGREMYEGWEEVSRSVLGGENLSPELEAIRQRSVDQSLGLNGRKKAGLEAYFRQGRPIIPSRVLAQFAVPAKEQFKGFYDNLMEEMYLTPAVVESQEAKETLVQKAQEAGLDITLELLNTPQGFEHYAKLTAQALSERAGY